MKKLISIILFIILTAVSVQAFETEYTSPSAVYSADQNAIISGAGYFYGIMVVTDGTNPVTVKVYDNTAATGTVKHDPAKLLSHYQERLRLVAEWADICNIA